MPSPCPFTPCCFDATGRTFVRSTCAASTAKTSVSGRRSHASAGCGTIMRRERSRSTSTVGLLLVAWFVVTSACGKHVPESMTAPPGVPRIGWVIMSGDRDNPDDEFVCQSSPRTDCVLPASRPDHPVFTDVHVYFHPTEANTKYTGTIDAGFVEGATPSKANVTVKPNTSAVPFTTVGMVVSARGEYRLTIAVSAQGATSRQIREQIPVQVR
jgi:hypothetical protein